MSVYTTIENKIAQFMKFEAFIIYLDARLSYGIAKHCALFLTLELDLAEMFSYDVYFLDLSYFFNSLL